ncbi:MAG TPA: hypothetical protein VLV49_01045 [Terriglobales bacterium]|nr:hypothetical protein [Terriglobales bacterium]
MGNKLLLLVILALAIPVVAHDHDTDQVTFTDTGGVLKGSSKGLSINASTLTAVIGPDKHAVTGANLGSFSLSTGKLTSGMLGTGAKFAGGGSLCIAANGKGDLRAGTLFQGSFTAPLSWSLTTLSNGTHQYTLAGTASGRYLGFAVKNVSVQLILNTGRGFYDGAATVYSGSTIATGQLDSD